MTETIQSDVLIMPARGRRVTRTTLYDLTYDDLRGRMAEYEQSPFRAAQVYDWAYKKLVVDYDQMANLPAELRATLNETLPMNPLTEVHAIETDDGETVKFLDTTHDGQLVETVLEMLHPDRATVCVSCQVGCAVGCAFCATGLGGLQRNLTAGEMVVQAVNAARIARERGRPLTNLVMMGMGEPFHNYRETMKFIGILNDQHGLEFGRAGSRSPPPVSCPVSRNWPRSPIRSIWLFRCTRRMTRCAVVWSPINDRFPARRAHADRPRLHRAHGRRISFEELRTESTIVTRLPSSSPICCRECCAMSTSFR